MSRRYRLGALLLSATALVATAGTAKAEDWIHWRGPEQTGHSRDTGLPDTWEPDTPGKNNLIWKAPVGYRSTPVIMGDRLYIIAAAGDVPHVQTQAEKLVTGERIVCLDANTGKIHWQRRFPVFLTDIVVTRLGWAPMTADPETKRIYAHTSAGFLVCLDGETGKTVWEHQLTQEFGRVTGYGGRVAGPICDSGLVIVGMAQGSWGRFARTSGRFVAFDKDTGKVVWWSETPFALHGTYYSNPVIAVINGERLIISGGSDGGLHAFQVRTGKRVWSYEYAAGVINPSPVVVGNYVLCAHGEENPEGGDIGRVICVDASKVKNGKPELVWQFRDGTRFGLASPATDGKYLYVPSDNARLYCFDIFSNKVTGSQKTNKYLWRYSYGTTARGAPVVADNKIYISEVNGRFVIIPLNGRRAPEKDFVVQFKTPPGGTGQVEVNSSPAVANGKVYLGNRDEAFCIGTGKGKVGEVPAPKNVEAKAEPGAAPAQLLVFPADVALKPGDTAEFTLHAFTAKGQALPDAKVTAEWSLPAPVVPKKEPAKKEAPAAPKAGGGPPPLDATLDAATGKITVNPKKPAQQGELMAKAGSLTATARVRVVAQIPYKQDFSKVPVGAVPGGWINAQGKYRVVDLKGKHVLFKVNDNARPTVSRAYSYITSPHSTGYTIEADIMCEMKKNKLPDAGVLNNNYTFHLDGKEDANGKRSLRLISWEALPRIDYAVPFDWKSGVWYHLKLTVEVGEKEAVIRGKAWPRDDKEPENWQINFKDPLPNREGAAAIYGYVANADADSPGSEIYYGDVVITPNGGTKAGGASGAGSK